MKKRIDGPTDRSFSGTVWWRYSPPQILPGRPVNTNSSRIFMSIRITWVSCYHPGGPAPPLHVPVPQAGANDLDLTFSGSPPGKCEASGPLICLYTQRHVYIKLPRGAIAKDTNWRLKAKEMYSFVTLEAGSLKARASRNTLPPKAGGKALPLPPPAPGVAGDPWRPLASLGWWTHHSGLCLHHHMAFSLHVCISVSHLVKTPVTGIRTSPELVRN